MVSDSKTVSVYIPDDLRSRAEEAGINLSATLRAALQIELDRRTAIANTLATGIEDHEVELEDVTGVITGKFLGATDDDAQFYLTDDERVLVYDRARERVDELAYPESDLAEWLQNNPRGSEVLASVMRQLGFRPRVQL